MTKRLTDSEYIIAEKTGSKGPAGSRVLQAEPFIERVATMRATDRFVPSVLVSLLLNLSLDLTINYYF